MRRRQEITVIVISDCANESRAVCQVQAQSIMLQLSGCFNRSGSHCSSKSENPGSPCMLASYVWQL